jgi:hypothetical protein
MKSHRQKQSFPAEQIVSGPTATNGWHQWSADSSESQPSHCSPVFYCRDALRMPLDLQYLRSSTERILKTSIPGNLQIQGNMTCRPWTCMEQTHSQCRDVSVRLKEEFSREKSKSPGSGKVRPCAMTAMGKMRKRDVCGLKVNLALKCHWPF